MLELKVGREEDGPVQGRDLSDEHLTEGRNPLEGYSWVVARIASWYVPLETFLLEALGQIPEIRSQNQAKYKPVLVYKDLRFIYLFIHSNFIY